MKKKEYIGSDVEYEQDGDKKFRITRGMLILGIIILIVLIAIIISLRSLIAGRKETYTTEDFLELEQRMVEETPIYISQKDIVLTDEKLKIDLKSLLLENGGSIDPDKNKVVNICKGYVLACIDEYSVYEPYIKCGNKYTTSGYEEEETTTKTKKKTTTTSKDKTKPDILIIGDAEINLYVGDTYNEPGYTATDNIDGDITASVKVDGKVDTSKPGTYTLTYVISDSSDNESKITRKVIVKEKETTSKTTRVNTTKQPVTTTTTKKIITPPVITLNGQSEITLIKDSYYDDPGYSAKDCYTNDITRYVVVTGSVNVHLIGQYKITYTVTDSYGNTTSVQRTINVIKDNTIKVEGLSLTPNDKTIRVGETYKLELQISPSNAADKSVIWTTSDSSVATISNGVVTGKKPGTAKITVILSSNNNIKASATVRVY